MKFTDQQEAIFAEGTQKHLNVVAGAGAGKTTSLVEMQKRSRQRSLYCPFNKTIAEDAKSKFLGTNCQVNTLHAFAWRAIRSSPQDRPHKGGSSDVRASGVMGRVMFPRVAGWGDYRLAAAVNRTVSKFCTSNSQRMDVEHARAALVESVGDPDTLQEPAVQERAMAALDALSQPLVDAARLYMKGLIEDQKYTHDVYLKLLDLSPPQLRSAFAGLRHVYKDEAQDNNPVETSILLKSGLPIISVGDPYQQIYSWRGAENALEQLPGKRMLLTESFRFDQSIADQAMRVLDALPKNKPDYRIIGAGDDRGRGRPANAILCRTNSGVIDAAISAARKGHAYFVDNAESLIADLHAAEDLRNGKQGRGLFSPFNTWDEAIAEAEAGDRTIDRLVKIVEDGRTNEVERVINKSMAHEDSAELTIMTAHRSKGREFPYVKLGEDWKTVPEMQKRWAKSRSKSERDETLALEDFNVLYVAVTRAESKVYGLTPLLQDKEPSPAYE